MKKRLKTPAVVALGTLVLGALLLGALVFPASAAERSSTGHWIDNVGAGTTAIQFSNGNTDPDCSTPAFLAGDYDLWVFEIDDPNNSNENMQWDDSVPVWDSPTPVVTHDVSTNFIGLPPNGSKKRLYIASTPPGARLEAAHLLYNGKPTSEILHHTCARFVDVALQGQLDIAYDIAYRWNVTTDVTWKAVDPYDFDLAYTATRRRRSDPIVEPGSAHVRGSLVVAEPGFDIETTRVEYTTDSQIIDCGLSGAGLIFDCSVDSSLFTIDPTTKRPKHSGRVIVTVITDDGPVIRDFVVDWGAFPPRRVFGTTAAFQPRASLLTYSEDLQSRDEFTALFGERWSLGSDHCETRNHEFELDVEPRPSDGHVDATSATVTWCRPRPGYSLQYLGGPYGLPLATATADRLRSQFPSALAGLPRLSNREQVRQFLADLFCDDTCLSLFEAQFFTAALNALDPAFADQTIMIRDQCISIRAYLREVDGEARYLDRTQRVIRKSELERINGALVTTCPSIRTSNGSATGSK